MDPDNDAPIYASTTNEQTVGVKSSSAPGQAHIDDFRNYGPPPRNYFVARRNLKDTKRPQDRSIIYADHAKDNTITTKAAGAVYHHPFSPQGLKDAKPTILAEFRDTRANLPGFFHVPFSYKPGDFQWKKHSSWQSAIAAGLNHDGVKQLKTGNLLSDQDINGLEKLVLADPKWKAQETHVLHHPADRDTVIFKDESMAAFVARRIGYSLVIVCPFIHADAVGWNRIWDVTNRPPIRARFSTGEQGRGKPLVLACLPVETLGKGREWYHREAYWFHLERTPGTAFELYYKETFRRVKPEVHVPQMLRAYHIPDDFLAEKFAWCLVTVQRRCTLGFRIPDKELGKWLSQYCNHIYNIGTPYRPTTFNFDAKKGYKGRPLSFAELTGWVMSCTFQSNMKSYIDNWDGAITAMITYQGNRNDKTYDDFRKKMNKASTPGW